MKEPIKSFSMKSSSLKELKFQTQPWTSLLSLTVLLSFLYVVMEWIFITTSPSFSASGMGLIGFDHKLSMFFIAGLILSLTSAIFLILLFGINLVARYQIWESFLFSAAKVIPAFLLACLLLLLVDNFTYTLFNIGIVTTMGRRRVIYAFLFIFLFVLVYIWTNRLLKQSTKDENKFRPWNAYLALGLLVISGVFTVMGLRDTSMILSEVRDMVSDYQIERPNIILLGVDGLNASHMSLYGYERDTTPTLRELAQESLVAENAFANATTSLGSITSMLTGKLPVTTRVLYRPDILVGLDAYQHLPGILKGYGYHTVEISFPYYADAYEANFRGGFDLVNNRSMESNPAKELGWRLGGDYAAFFLGAIYDRISSRLLHVFFIESMDNPYSMVTTLPGELMNDRERIDQLITFIDNAESPQFIHVHMMGTHGPFFSPRERVFSKDKSQDEAFMIDFYDDAILDFDKYVSEVIAYLDQQDLLDRTILVIYTDHGMKYTTKDRLPLIIRFPYGEFSGKMSNNVQNLDVPATILDYLGLEIPAWMHGESLLKGEPSPWRSIYSSAPTYLTLSELNISGNHVELWGLDLGQIKPPFYQFGWEKAIICHQWYRLNLVNQAWEYGEIFGHTSPCDESSMPTIDQVQAELIQHLMVNGFNINSLEINKDFSFP